MVLATPVKCATRITSGPGETKEDAWFHWIKIERGRQPHTDRHRQKKKMIVLCEAMYRTLDPS